jgi:hypothetical protein
MKNLQTLLKERSPVYLNSRSRIVYYYHESHKRAGKLFPLSPARMGFNLEYRFTYRFFGFFIINKWKPMMQSRIGSRISYSDAYNNCLRFRARRLEIQQNAFDTMKKLGL